MKQFRALLEDDLGLPEKSLREHKEAIEEMVDQVCFYKAWLYALLSGQAGIGNLHKA